MLDEAQLNPTAFQTKTMPREIASDMDAKLTTWTCFDNVA